MQNILSSSASTNGQMGYWYQGTIGISQAKKYQLEQKVTTIIQGECFRMVQMKNLGLQKI